MKPSFASGILPYFGAWAGSSFDASFVAFASSLGSSFTIEVVVSLVVARVASCS